LGGGEALEVSASSCFVPTPSLMPGSRSKWSVLIG
jgi:hypothetical protein